MGYDPDLIRDQIAQVSKAFVFLVLKIYQADQGSRYLTRSGFIVEVEGRWLWMTAGHVIDGIEDFLREDGEADFYLNWPPDPTWPIPFVYADADRLSMSQLVKHHRELMPDSHEHQADFFNALEDADIGYLVLRPLYVKNLEAAGVVPLRWNQVRSPSDEDIASVDADGLQLFLFGIPESSWMNDRGGVNPMATFKSLALRLPRDLDRDGPHVLASPKLRFVPDFGPDLHIGSLVGMSGGPIMVLGGAEPLLIAVQSAQLSTGRGTPRELIGIRSDRVLDLIRAITATIHKARQDGTLPDGS